MLVHWPKLYQGTDSEHALEPAIAALGKRYRWQHPFWGLRAFADFVLLDDRVVIEVDGSSHDTKQAKAKDQERTRKLEALGWVVVRCRNEEAQADPQGTVARLLQEAAIRRQVLDTGSAPGPEEVSTSTPRTRTRKPRQEPSR